MRKILLFAAMLLMMASCATLKSNTAWHDKLQDEASFDNRLAANESFTKKSYAEDIKFLKNKLADLEKTQAKNDTKSKQLETLAELRAKIAELENKQ